MNVQVVVIHEGATLGANATGNTVVAAPWQGPIIGIVQALQNTTIDLVIAGHTHRAANTIVGHIPVVEGVNAGASYSVAQLMVKDGDVAWAGTASRTAKNLGVSGRSDVQAIVDKANADTAPLRNQVVGTQSVDIKRDPTRLSESAMGNLVADAMLAKYPEAVAAVTNSGGLRQDILISPPTANEQPGQITWGEVFAVLPFGNRAAIETLTGAQLQAGLLNGVSPACDPNIATGRFPQVAGLKIAYHCSGTTAVIDSITHNGTAVTPAEQHPHRHQRLHAHGWRRLYGVPERHRRPASRTPLLELTIEYITAHSPGRPGGRGEGRQGLSQSSCARGFVLGERAWGRARTAAHRGPAVRAGQRVGGRPTARGRRERVPGVALLRGVRRVAPGADRRRERGDEGALRVRLRRLPARCTGWG